MRAALPRAFILVASGCGGVVAIPPGSDSGLMATSSGTSSSHAVSPPDIADASCLIEASNYDQSCTTDTDCTPVTVGDLCGENCACPNSAINGAALAQYRADVAGTPFGSGALGQVTSCVCPAEPPPCCRRAQCTMQCMSASDTLPACADMGAQCIYGYECEPIVVPNACAYADQTCCPLGTPLGPPI